jgi:serine/threonine protein kinase
MPLRPAVAAGTLGGPRSWTKQYSFETARDIWALGCITMAMAPGLLASGELLHPFGQELTDMDDMAGVYRFCRRVALGELRPAAPQPKPGCAFGEQLQSFVEACTQRDPLQRWSAEQLLGHPLLQLES